MSLPLISVIVPVYNAQKYLEKCVDSLRTQTYENIEILLINDGSSDGSGELCDRLAEADDRIRVVHQENQGVSAARNHGIRCADGEFLLFVDSDDTAFPAYAETLYREITEHEADFVICGYRICSPKRNRDIHFENDIFLTDIPGCEQVIMQIYSQRLLNSPCNKMYRKSMIRTDFDPSLTMGEDLVFNLQYLKNVKKMKVTSKVLYNYIVHENSAVTTYKPNRMDNVVRINRYLLDYFSNVFTTSNCHETLIAQGIKEIDAVYRHLFRGGNTTEERKALIKVWSESEEYRDFCGKYAPAKSIFLKDPKTLYRCYNLKTWLERKIVKILS